MSMTLTVNVELAKELGKKTTKLFASLILPITIVGCVHQRNLSIDEHQGIICEWGKQKINLCSYSSDGQRVEALLEEMTLAEKIGQMTQSVWHNNVSPNIIRQYSIGSIIHTEGPVPGETPQDWTANFDRFQRAALNTRLGIPLLIAVDAVHGQNTFDGAVIFPHNIGLAATRNMKLVQRAAEITAIETAGTGFNWTFSPCIAMPQHEHWGRVYEGFSEDRDLTIAATIASIRGHQGEALSSAHTVAATAKHYIGDGATENGIEGGNALINEQDLRQTYLPPYISAVEQDVAAVMVGFNSVNGINMHQHQHLVTDVLKKELGFSGVVVTDWDGGQRFGPAHGVINAGIDIAMQPGNHQEFIEDLSGSVKDGTVSLKRIDDAVRRILKLKFKLGLFARPFAKSEFSEQVGSEAHRAVARQAVRESLVLLKNKNQALPLSANERIAVVGEHAQSSGLQSGGWSIHWQGQTESYRGSTTIFDAIKAAGKSVEHAEKGCYADMQADKIVVVVGEQPYAEGAGDTDELWLNDQHKALISNCTALQKPTIVILISGRVLVIEEQLKQSDAFVAAWLPGSEGGGVADFLFGSKGFKPVGKSPYAWPRKVSDLPLDKHDSRALFQFGYGLSDY